MITGCLLQAARTGLTTRQVAAAAAASAGPAWLNGSKVRTPAGGRWSHWHGDGNPRARRAGRHRRGALRRGARRCAAPVRMKSARRVMHGIRCPPLPSCNCIAGTGPVLGPLIRHRAWHGGETVRHLPAHTLSSTNPPLHQAPDHWLACKSFAQMAPCARSRRDVASRVHFIGIQWLRYSLAYLCARALLGGTPTLRSPPTRRQRCGRGLVGTRAAKWECLAPDMARCTKTYMRCCPT